MIPKDQESKLAQPLQSASVQKPSDNPLQPSTTLYNMSDSVAVAQVRAIEPNTSIVC